jgi:hypothetical protein
MKHIFAVVVALLFLGALGAAHAYATPAPAEAGGGPEGLIFRPDRDPIWASHPIWIVPCPHGEEFLWWFDRDTGNIVPACAPSSAGN